MQGDKVRTLSASCFFGPAFETTSFEKMVSSLEIPAGASPSRDSNRRSGVVVCCFPPGRVVVGAILSHLLTGVTAEEGQ